MNYYLRILSFLLPLIFCSRALCSPENPKSCKITIASSGEDSNRHSLAALASKNPILICPFSDGESAELLEVVCHPELTEGLKQSKLDYLTRSEIRTSIDSCAPEWSIRDKRMSMPSSVVSYLMVDTMDSSQPTGFSARAYKIDHNARQLMAETGAPIVYYNWISNVTCFSVQRKDAPTIDMILNDFGFRVPDGVRLTKSTLSCPELVEKKFGLSLPTPLN